MKHLFLLSFIFFSSYSFSQTKEQKELTNWLATTGNNLLNKVSSEYYYEKVTLKFTNTHIILKKYSEDPLGSNEDRSIFDNVDLKDVDFIKIVKHEYYSYDCLKIKFTKPHVYNDTTEQFEDSILIEFDNKTTESQKKEYLNKFKALSITYKN